MPQVVISSARPDMRVRTSSSIEAWQSTASQTMAVMKQDAQDGSPGPTSPTMSINLADRKRMQNAMQRFDERKRGVQSSVKLRQRGISKYLLANHSKDNILDSATSAIFGASTGRKGGHWVDSNQAKSIFCGIIVLNAIFIGVDTSVSHGRQEEDIYTWSATFITMFVCEIIFLLLFVTEVTLRLLAERRAFLRDPWNIFDSFILAMTIADTSVSIGLYLSSVGVGDIHYFGVFTTLRVARVLRLLRLFRFVQELNLILAGMGGSLGKLFWCLSLLFICIYMASIFTLRYIGQDKHLKHDEDIQAWFGTLGRSMFTLFSFVTLEGWPDITRYLMDDDVLGPEVAVPVVLFIIFTNLAVLNLVAAVVLESIMVAAENDQHKRQARLERERVQAVQRLARVFTSIHPDHHAGLPLADFRAAVLEHPELKAELSRLDVLSQDVDELFHLMDCDGDGVLSVHEFIEGLLRMQSGVASAKHVMSLQYDLQHMWNTLGQGQDALAEGQLFLRDDLRSGQRQLARRIEAKLERLLLHPAQRRRGSDDAGEAETPTAAPVLQRQNNQNLAGWQWRGREQVTVPPTPGSEASLHGQAHKMAEQVVELLEPRLSTIVRQNVDEACDALRAKLLKDLRFEEHSEAHADAEQKGEEDVEKTSTSQGGWPRRRSSAAQDEVLRELLMSLEALPRRLQDELMPALRGTASTVSPVSLRRDSNLGAHAQLLDDTYLPSRPSEGVPGPRNRLTPSLSLVSPKASPTSTAAGEMRNQVSGMLAGSDGIVEMPGLRGRSRSRLTISPVQLPDTLEAGQLSPGVVPEQVELEAMATPNSGFGGTFAPAPRASPLDPLIMAEAQYQVSFDGNDSRLLPGSSDQLPPWRPSSPHAAAFEGGSDHVRLRDEPPLWRPSSPQAGAPSPHSVQSCRHDLWPRLLNVQRWAVERGLANMPFDKLVLHLESLGIQLSIPEQDALKSLMRGGA